MKPTAEQIAEIAKRFCCIIDTRYTVPLAIPSAVESAIYEALDLAEQNAAETPKLEMQAVRHGRMPSASGGTGVGHTDDGALTSDPGNACANAEGNPAPPAPAAPDMPPEPCATDKGEEMTSRRNAVENGMTIPIPISAAKKIADAYGYDQVVIIARKVGNDGCEHVTTYGADKANCEVAARMGDFLKYKVMGWAK